MPFRLIIYSTDMNKIVKFLSFCLIVFALSACKKDIGNYNYHDINEWTISEIAQSYSAFQGSVLHITPTITYTKDHSNDTSKYTYTWTSVDNKAIPVSRKIIARTKNLNWTVSNPASDAAYTLLYEVTEKSTGLTFRSSANLMVTSIISDGWLILNDINGNARLDFLNHVKDDFVYFNNILASNSTLTLTGKPKLLYFCQRRDPFTLITAKSIFIGTDQSSFIINTQDNSFGNFWNMTKSMSNYIPAPYFAEKIRSQGDNLTYMLDSKGQLLFENPIVGYSFGNAVNLTSDGTPFRISPYFAEAYGSIATYALMYDIDKKCFMEHKFYNTTSSVPSTTSTLFNPGNMNMDLMYMDYTAAFSGQTFALLKDNANKVHLARIVCDYSTFSPRAFDEVMAPEMLNATQFAIDPSEGYIMYSVGSKVYRYNPSDQSNTMIIDMGSRKISLIKYQRFVYAPKTASYTEYAKKLIVCSYDDAAPATSGTMDLYTIPGLNGAPSLYHSFTGLGKIVEVTYKE